MTVDDDASQANHTSLDAAGRLEVFNNPRLVAPVMATCAKLGITCVDLLPSLRDQGEQRYFADDAHWNRMGHSLIGNLLAAELRGELGSSSRPEQ